MKVMRQKLAMAAVKISANEGIKPLKMGIFLQSQAPETGRKRP
jgi:hypothetical protein